MIEHRTLADAAALQGVLDWARQEGWNPGRADAALFHAADPEGFFVAVSDGTPVAAISVVNHSPSFAFLGLYLCLPAYRGRGIGYALWQHALRHAGDRVVGLDGVPAQQGNYERSGFVAVGETARYQGRLDGRHDPELRVATSADVPKLVALEGAASGWDKPAYMSRWFQPIEGHRTFVQEGADGITACATVRACAEGAKIGPLIAPDVETAERLIRHAQTEVAGDIVIDVPSTSPGLADRVQALGLSCGFRTARMYRGTPRMPGSAVYAPATLELG